MLEAAGTEIAPVLRRGFTAADLAPLVASASAREADEALACITAVENFLEVRYVLFPPN